MVWKVRGRGREVSRRLGGPSVLQVRAASAEKWEARDVRGVEARGADEDVQGVQRAGARDAARGHDFAYRALYHGDVGSGERLKVVDSRGRATAADARCRDDNGFESCVLELAFHCLGEMGAHLGLRWTGGDEEPKGVIDSRLALFAKF